jgi:adenylyl- and sulfurtransferase ThiI
MSVEAGLRGSAILRWTGRGRIEDLESSVKAVLRVEKAKASLGRCGGSVIVEGGDPVGAAILFRYMPGVSWIAVGQQAASLGELGARAAGLARAYLRLGDRFSVAAESDGVETAASDVAGAVSSAILGEVKGVRMDEGNPKVRFRAVYGRRRGAVGVELRPGPGGTPTGEKDADCFVSGGMHSAVVAWHVLLSGFGVRLVHVKVSEESLRAVAKLYAELSNRVDPRRLSLEVMEGGGVLSAFNRRQTSRSRPIFAGFHAECGGVPKNVPRRVQAPLLLATEEEYELWHSALSVGWFLAKEDWLKEERGEGAWKSFGGARTDMHGVLDGLR